MMREMKLAVGHQSPIDRANAIRRLVAQRLPVGDVILADRKIRTIARMKGSRNRLIALRHLLQRGH